MTLTPVGIASADDDPLAPEPANLTGALIGYARVSTSGQILDRQTRALTEAGCIRVFADKQSGKTADRPELAACLDYLRVGDTLVVPSLDRLSRSLQDLIAIVTGLRRSGTGFRSLHEALDTTTPGGRLVFHVFAALAEFIRELIVEGTREGLDAARVRGQRLGRPPAMTGEQIRQARSVTRISSGAPPLAVNGPVSHVAADQTQHVFYLAASGEIIELWWRGNDVPHAENLTLQAQAPLARISGEGFIPPLASHYVQSEDTQHVFFADAHLTPWEIWWSRSGPKTPENLTKLAGAPATYASGPFHSLVTADGNQHVIIAANFAGGFIDLVARP